MSALRSSRGRGGHKLKNEMNVVPYIDVMLVLLVIFMVTAPMITPGVIELPTVGRASSVPLVPLEIQIGQDGELSWRKREPGGEFQSVARDAVAQTILQVREPDQPVLIAAHGKVPYEAVVELMDRLRSNGVDRLGLLVDQQQGDKPVVTTPATGS
ncbi:MAG: ExbD/TolR family protein [Burkholderiaceae bacterium]|nr:ExbD/TolR family protein [Burkholderiaceae bacterium]MCD8517304.1 ExbD/TolR family protein [Burkholderiaceae bacterium]MCD8537604.1 ExbD/TolR family protein [Burkholderiaceae bacterium]MCD8566002.1 ExbD/TolR family protein [Burkholderiaceae bacterium]